MNTYLQYKKKLYKYIFIARAKVKHKEVVLM